MVPLRSTVIFDGVSLLLYLYDYGSFSNGNMKSLSGDYIINEFDDNIVGSCVQVLTTDQRFMENCL